VPPEFWQTEMMVDALASGNVGQVIRAYRCHPFHGQRLPQTLVAGWLHMSQAAVCRIETGRRRLTIDEIGYIVQVLGLPLVAVLWALQQHGEDVDPLSRRSLLGVGVGAALSLNATTASHQIDPELATHWMKLLGTLGRHDAVLGAHDVLPAVRREIELIAAHREVAQGQLRTELYRVESRWAEFACWLSNDAGDVRGRERWADRAFRLAQEIGYSDMIAWILLRRSRWAAEERDAERAIALAGAARRTSVASGHIRALCSLKEAQGHAVANATAACERELAAGYDVLSRTDASEPGLSIGRLPTGPYLAAAEARCWLWLRPRRAVTAFEDVLRLLPHDRTRSRGIQRARLAQACAAAGDRERAAAEGLKAMAIVRTTRSDLTMRELARLDHRLAACDAPAAADFREAFATL
jgi:hypothetical protein